MEKFEQLEKTLPSVGEHSVCVSGMVGGRVGQWWWQEHSRQREQLKAIDQP